MWYGQTFSNTHCNDRQGIKYCRKQTLIRRNIQSGNISLKLHGMITTTIHQLKPIFYNTYLSADYQR